VGAHSSDEVVGWGERGVCHTQSADEDALVLIIMAGPIAEYVYDNLGGHWCYISSGNLPIFWHYESDYYHYDPSDEGSDSAKLEQFLRQHPRNGSARFGQLNNIACRFVVQNWPHIAALAEEIMVNGSVSGAKARYIWAASQRTWATLRSTRAA
jgi:hypothetical protein